MTNKIQNFAIVGCGRIAERHAIQITERGVLTAVCDIVPQKADSLAKLYGATAYYDLDTLLANEKDIDIMAICTPNGLHAMHSIQSLRAGCHVICEKPMAISVQDCEKMISESEKANRRLFIVKQNRYNPPVTAVKKLLDEGRLGKITSVQLNCFWNRDAGYYKDSWKGTRQLDGGTLYTQFSHFIDLLYWMVGDVETVQGMLGNLQHRGVIEFEDTGVLSMHFKNGAIGSMHYTVNSFQKNMEGSLTLFGEKGTIKIGGEYLNKLEYQQINDHVIEELAAGNSANQYGTYTGSMSNHDKVYDNVMAVLEHNAQQTTSAFEGLKTVEIIQKIYSSGTWI